MFPEEILALFSRSLTVFCFTVHRFGIRFKPEKRQKKNRDVRSLNKSVISGVSFKHISICHWEMFKFAQIMPTLLPTNAVLNVVVLVGFALGLC